jgi:hypothetical protein
MALDFSDYGTLAEAGSDELDFSSLGTPVDGPQGGFVASAKQAVGSTIKGAGQLAADIIPGVGQDNPLKRYGQEVVEANPTAVKSFSDIADKPGTAVAEATGNAASSIGGPLAARALGMGITAASPLAGPAAPVVAGVGQIVAWLGPVAIAALPSYGGIRDKQILNDPQAEQDAKAKAVAALGAGTVGLIETKFGPQQWALSAMTREGRAALAKKFAETGIIKGLGFGAAKGAAIEGAEELAQNPIEQLAGFDNPLKPENLKETAFGGAMGAIGGGVLGGGTGAAVNIAKPKTTISDVLAAPDVDSAIQTANEVLALPAPGAVTGETILATERGSAGTAAQFDVLRRQADIREAGGGMGRNADITDVVPKETAAAPTDAAFLLERQGDPLAPMIEDRRIRTEALDAAQQEAEQRKAAEVEAIPELAAEQNTIQSALERAGSLESPTAMQLALQKAKAPPAPAIEPVASESATAEPRIVERSPDMIAMPRKLAEMRAEASGGEVVRIQNKSGKFAYTVIPKAADVSKPSDVSLVATAADGGGSADAGASIPAGVRADGAAGNAVDTGSLGNEPARQPVSLGRDGNAEPVATWFGRRGDGYLTQGDAMMAIPSRQRVAPELNWQVEAMPTGKFRLAGYAGEAVKSVDANIPRIPDGVAQNGVVPADAGRSGVAIQREPDAAGIGEYASDARVAGENQQVPAVGAVNPDRLAGSGPSQEPANAAVDGQPANGRAADSSAQVTQTPPPSGVSVSAPTERERIAAMQQAAKERRESEAQAKSERMAAEVEKARGKSGNGSDSAMAAMQEQRKAAPTPELAEQTEAARRSEIENLSKAQLAAAEAFAGATPAVHRAEAERIDKAAADLDNLPEIKQRYEALAESHRASAERKEGEAAKPAEAEEAHPYEGEGTLELHAGLGPQATIAAVNKFFTSPKNGRPKSQQPSSRSVISGLALPQVWQAPDETRLDDLIYSLQDKHIDTKRVRQAVRDSIGQIADEQDPYLQEELFHGRAAMATKEFLEKSIRPLLTEMQARGVDMSDFEEFLHNRHAERRNVQVAKVNPKMQDGGSGIKTADARAYLAGLPVGKKRAYEALAKRVDQINRETRALLVSSGLEKQETIDAWEAAYGDEYVPLMREEMENGQGIGQGYSVRGSASKRAMGSDKPVADIIANIALQRERTITRANKRRIGEALYGLVLKAPNDDFWFAVDPALQSNPSHIMATQMQLISMGMDPADAQSIANEPKTRYIGPDGKVAERINPALRSAENVLAVRIDGEDKFVFFNVKDERAMRMVMALKNLDADQLGTVMGTVAKMTRWFAAVNTQYNPIFGVTNITRDVQTALLNLNSTPLKSHKAEVMKHILPALRGIYIDLRDHRAGKQPTSSYAAIFEEFQREGGATGYRDMYANAQERADAIADELAKINQGKAIALGRGIMGWLSDYNETMENAVRVAAYKVGKEQGLSSQQAASIAKNLTVNFNRKGQVALQAGALYAFFNASVQGSARMAQTMWKDGKLTPAGQKIIAGGLLLGVMQALLLAAAGFDEDEPPDFVRERALVIPIGGKKYVAIPMPLGFHVIPNLGRIPTEWAMGGFKNTPKRIGQIIGLFADAFNPIGSAGLSLQTLTPTIIDPLAALSENRDWTGKPIAKKDFNAMAPTAGHTRAKDTATPWAKLISWTVNAATGGTDYKPGLASPTPDQIDYLIGQVTGGVGREIGKIAQVASGTMSGEDVPLHKIPLVGRFVGTTEGQAAEASRFYDNLREIGEHKAEIEGLRKDGKGAQITAYIRENRQALMVPMAEAIYRDVSKLQKVKRDLIKKDAPRDRVKVIEMQITARMKALNDRVRAAEKRTTETSARTGR